jgi:hypothetical protein
MGSAILFGNRQTIMQRVAALRLPKRRNQRTRLVHIGLTSMFCSHRALTIRWYEEATGSDKKASLEMLVFCANSGWSHCDRFAWVSGVDFQISIASNK